MQNRACQLHCQVAVSHHYLLIFTRAQIAYHSFKMGGRLHCCQYFHSLTAGIGMSLRRHRCLVVSRQCRHWQEMGLKWMQPFLSSMLQTRLRTGKVQQPEIIWWRHTDACWCWEIADDQICLACLRLDQRKYASISPLQWLTAFWYMAQACRLISLTPQPHSNGNL